MTKKNDMNFEEKMNKLQKIVSELEKENVDLDKSIALYKEGLELTKSLKDELKIFEDKINKINEE